MADLYARQDWGDKEEYEKYASKLKTLGPYTKFMGDCQGPWIEEHEDDLPTGHCSEPSHTKLKRERPKSPPRSRPKPKPKGNWRTRFPRLPRISEKPAPASAKRGIPDISFPGKGSV